MRKFFILCFLLLSFEAAAKRDFAVYNELRCDARQCYDKESGLPFTGMLRSFYDNGRVQMNLEYKNGIRDGLSNYYYLSGNERKQEVYVKGLLQGMLTEYYDNGNLKLEVAFDNGKKNGKFRSYYENGQLKLEEHYINDKIDGRARKYNNQGKIVREAFYNEGELISGTCVSFSGKKRVFTQKAIDAYNTKGIVPCDLEKAVTF